MSARSLVDRNESVHARVHRLLSPFFFCDVVVDDATDLCNPVDDPFRFAERGDEEAYSFFERGIDPLDHTLVVCLG